jgi:hypothetical protein
MSMSSSKIPKKAQEQKKYPQYKYPMNFKHDVLTCARQLAEKLTKDAQMNSEKKPEYWIPSGLLHKAKTHKSEQLVSKKEASEQMKFNKEGPWEESQAQKDREHIFLKFSDAEECRFVPQLGWRVPKQWQEDNPFDVGGVGYKKPDKDHLEKWTEALKNNFETRFKARMGQYKKAAVNYYQSGGIKEPYKILNTNFNIEA